VDNAYKYLKNLKCLHCIHADICLRNLGGADLAIAASSCTDCDLTKVEVK
jgi:hypothetical protein